MKKILVPTDFSNLCQDALNVALKIAKQIDGEVYLFNAIHDLHDVGFNSTGTTDTDHSVQKNRYILELHRKVEAKMNSMIDNATIGGIKVYQYITIGDMQDKLVEFIEKHDIYLVVMATSGETTFDEFFDGNHTEQIMRISEAPVIAVRNAIPDFDIKHIVMATDLRTDSHDGMEHVKVLRESFDAQTHVVHVVGADSSKDDKIEAKLRKFADDHGLKNYELKVFHSADTEDGILKYASEVDADLIAVITHGRSGLAHFFFGSLAEDLVKDARMPVMSMHMD